jgi:phage virion morphogenesis protein
MLHLSLKTSPEAVKRRLARFNGRAKDLKPLRKEFAECMVSSTKKTFSSGGRPNKWKPSKRAATTGGKTLIKSARLKKSITGKVRGEDVLVGTNVAYGRVHQLGIDERVTEHVKTHTRRTKIGVSIVKAHTRTRRMKLPARPFLKVLASDRRYLRKALKRHMAGGK